METISITGVECLIYMLEERKKTLLKKVANNDENINTNVLARLAELEYLQVYLTHYQDYAIDDVNLLSYNINMIISRNKNNS